MERLFDEEFYRTLQRYTLQSRIKMNAGMGGGRKSNAKGSSVEFADFREYQLGDDIRRIDWNAYGRMNKLFVKLFMEEREGMFTILTDCSASMEYGQVSKFFRARQIAGMFAYMVLRNLDRVCLVNLSEEGTYKGKSLTGMQSFDKVLRQLEAYQAKGKVDLYQAVARLPFSNRGVCIVLSDFLDQPALEEMCRYLLYQKQEIVLVQVLAKEEQDITLEGDYNLLGVEDGQEVRISFTKTAVKKYRELFENHQRQLEKMAMHYHITLLMADTGEPLEKILAKGIAAGQIGV